MVSPLRKRFHRLKVQITQITCLVIGSFLLASLGYAQSPKYVRVAVLQDAASLSLKVSGSYEIIDSVSQKILSKGNNLKTTVTAYKNMILLGRVKSNSPSVFIKPDRADSIVINGRRYRGNIEIKSLESGLLVINYIDLEDYVKGILYHETSHYWPMEVLKAQAIACRTYAVYESKKNKLKDFDLTSGVYSQVYGGKTSERYRTNKAVDETRHKILTFKGSVFPAYFHATCAGRTEDARLLWNIDIAPLKGVTCDFCKDSPHFNWHYVLSLEEIAEKLTQAGFKVSRIKDIVILARDNSNRITDLNIVAANKSLKISAKDFRNIIGPNIIRSTNFNINVVNHDAVFQGLGWGHGVGLCQWGAYFMAKEGYSSEQILKYYYPQSNVETIRF